MKKLEENCNFPFFVFFFAPLEEKMMKMITRRRMARERRGAESSVVSMETLYYKIIY